MPQQALSPDLFKMAVLLLEDGHFFLGRSFGFANQISIDNGQVVATDTSRLCGELCFNTCMAGYQEVLSDPSYSGQFICFSFPHIGNVGCNSEDYECIYPYALGMICREYPTEPSNWRSQSALFAWLQQHRIGGICGMDTRALVQHLRDCGSQRALLGCLDAENGQLAHGSSPKPEVISLLLKHLHASPNMIGQNLASKVSRAAPEFYRPSVGSPVDTAANVKWLPQNTADSTETPMPAELHVAVLDFGCKENILRLLERFVSKVTVLPLQSSWQDIAALRPDGLLLSNGPGDPEPAYAEVAKVLQQALAVRLPIFGICLGHQILGLALGAQTLHMHHGHQGSNHPVLNIGRNTVEITSQNHGFCIAEDSLPQGVEITHRSLFDSCIEGIRSLEYPAFSVQYHPESSPGPHEAVYLFGDFVNLMEKNANVT